MNTWCSKHDIFWSHSIEHLFVCCSSQTDEGYFLSLFFTYSPLCPDVLWLWAKNALVNQACLFQSPCTQSLLLQYVWMSQRQHNKADWRSRCGIMRIDGSQGNQDGDRNLEGQGFILRSNGDIILPGEPTNLTLHVHKHTKSLHSTKSSGLNIEI